MLILLCVLFLVLTVVLAINCDWDNFSATISLIVFCVFLIITLCTWIDVSEGKVIDEKITMYQEENANIENEMNILVQQYMSYESDTFGNLKGDSSITLVSLYPELKADTLVTKQIEVYVANNEKIKELKEDKIELSVQKWWLYFGK